MVKPAYVDPPSVVTVTVRPPVEISTDIANVAVSVVPPLTATLLTLTPRPDTETVVEPETNSVPVIVTETVAPGNPYDGEIDDTVGTQRTLNVIALLVPPAVATVT